MVPVREAYTQWAPHYDAETAVTCLEDQMVRALAVPTDGRRVLDAGCGTGRRLRRLSQARAVGVDLTLAMLTQASPRLPLAAADIRALPFANRSFDVLFCRLVLGHLHDPSPAYAEFARVCAPDGAIVVTDFHAAAVAAGHRRTFKDGAGRTGEVEHYVHDEERHVRAAEASGLRVERRDSGVVGPPIREMYAAADKLAQYEAQLGLPLVLMLVCRAHPR